MSDTKITDDYSVVLEWKAGKNARNITGTLWCKDNVLWSQGVKIGVRTDMGVCVVGDYTTDSCLSVDDTTVKHITMAKKKADTIFHELVCESSSLFTEEGLF